MSNSETFWKQVEFGKPVYTEEDIKGMCIRPCLFCFCMGVGATCVLVMSILLIGADFDFQVLRNIFTK